MSKENLTPETVALIAETVNQTHQITDFGVLVEFLTETFSDAQLSEMYGTTPQHRFQNFQNFKHTYNLLVKINMYLSPDIKEVTTLE